MPRGVAARRDLVERRMRRELHAYNPLDARNDRDSLGWLPSAPTFWMLYKPRGAGWNASVTARQASTEPYAFARLAPDAVAVRKSRTRKLPMLLPKRPWSTDADAQVSVGVRHLRAVPIEAGVATGAQPHRPGVGYEVAQRLLDVVLATLLLLVLLPVLVLAALMIKLDSPGPVFFRQSRCGFGRRRFVVLKFRTMRHGACAEVHRQYIAGLAAGAHGAGPGLKKLTDDARVTRSGALLRKTSLDELPQLLNVLVGQMSIVGPRPAIDYELEHYAPAHYARFDVRPGLTGLWQVTGRNRLGFAEMLELDCEYVRSRSLRKDLSILLRTPLALLRTPGA